MTTGTDEREIQKMAEIFSRRAGTIKELPGAKSWLPPWLFKHQDLIQALDSAFTVDEEELINTLNYIHFMEGHVLVLLKHPKYEESILLKAYLEPRPGKGFTCHLLNGQFSDLELENYQYLNLIIDDGRSMILVPPVLEEMTGEYLKIGVPEASYGVGQRCVRRYFCQDAIGVDIIQEGFIARGNLLDFSPEGFRVKVTPDPACSFNWLNEAETLTVHLKDDKQILFSGPCQCIRLDGAHQSREVVLKPMNMEIKRFQKKRLRNHRQQLMPSPQIIFKHPLLGRKIQLDVKDISSAGFSVHEEQDERVLASGMILPEVTINFAGGLKMKCSAQVIYGADDGEEGFRSGIAILDMDIDTYSNLCHILSCARDSHAYVSREVDLDALWEFFFHAGFIYPKKYRLIQSHRKDFKETYRRLYQENPEVSRHFTYQKNGRVYGHISMVRAYQRAWMIHHHAALALSNKRTGFVVLKQIMHYLNDMYRLPSAKIDYVMAYFRPENKFPDRVFGGFSRALENPEACSLDTFAYLPYTSLSLGTDLPEEWALEESSPMHLWELERYYRNHSGGLLLDILNLGKDGSGEEPVERVYERLGFERGWGAYSLTHENELCAVLIADKSDLGFNLSELLNSIKVLVTNPEKLPWDVLSSAIAQLTRGYNLDKVPILFYPYEYVNDHNIPHEKQYHLWILDVNYSDDYLEYMQKRFRVI